MLHNHDFINIYSEVSLKMSTKKSFSVVFTYNLIQSVVCMFLWLTEWSILWWTFASTSDISGIFSYAIMHRTWKNSQLLWHNCSSVTFCKHLNWRRILSNRLHNLSSQRQRDLTRHAARTSDEAELLHLRLQIDNGAGKHALSQCWWKQVCT